MGYGPPRDPDAFFESISIGWWRQHNGVLIEIRNMDDRHVYNTVQMIQRWGRTCEDKYTEMVEELRVRWAKSSGRLLDSSSIRVITP